MKLKNKFLISYLAIGLIPLTIVWGMSVYTSYKNLKESYETEITALTRAKKSELMQWEKQLENNITDVATQDDLVDAMIVYEKEFNSVVTNNIPSKKEDLIKYYSSEFNRLYEEKNTTNKFDQYSNLIEKFSDKEVFWQHKLIFSNSNKIGEKHLLTQITDGSAYAEKFNKHHVKMKSFIEKYGYYDFFMIDLAGNVVYSMYKETDFASNLTAPRLANSGLGKLFKGLKDQLAKKETNVLFTDIEPYFPSYNAPAAFMGYPIFRNGVVYGFAAIQLPVPAIDSIISSDQKWSAAGLGKTGDIFLVGLEDQLLKTNVRHFAENKDQFLKSLNNKIVSEDKKKLMLSHGTTALGITLKDDYVSFVKSGKEYTNKTLDFTNHEVLVHAESFNFGNNKWAIIAKIQTQEVFKSFYQSLYVAAFIIICSIVVVLVVAFKISNMIVTPIVKVSNSMKDFMEGKLNSKIDLTLKDEVGDMARGFDSTMDHMIKIFNSDKVDWSEVALQKARELEAQKKVEMALEEAQFEKVAALKSKELAEIEQLKAKEAMEKAEVLAENEKRASIELQEKVDKILSNVRAAQSGDLTQSLSVTGSDAIGQLADGLRDFFASLSIDLSNIDRMSKSLEEQADILNQKNNLMNKNSHSAAQNSQSMKEKSIMVSSNIKNLNHSTQEMKQAVNEIAKQATESSKYSTDAVTYVSSVKEFGQKLEINTEDISRFLQVINSIARQTNGARSFSKQS